MPEETLFYTRRQLAELAQVTVNALSNLARRGGGPRCFCLPGTSIVRYPREEAEAWLRGEGGADKSSRGGASRRRGRKTKAQVVSDRRGAAQ